jgi:hypothetical protein
MSETKGTCLQTFIPMRNEPRSGAEMVSSLIFGESYTIIENQKDWLKIITEFDQYEGWISGNTYAPSTTYTQLVDTDFVEAFAKGEKILIPCGGLIPEGNKFILHDKSFELKFNLKPNHHLPLKLRLINTAKTLLNAPYLWGGRCFMGIDCSGFVQVVFKANAISLPRDTKQQITCGTSVSFPEIQSGDLVFFKKPDGENVSHVGLMISNTEIIHASGLVRIDKLSLEGIVIDKQLDYALIDIRRIVN